MNQKYLYIYVYDIYTHIMYIVKYYSAFKNKEILLFATTWVNLEGIMLSEINWGKANTAWYHLYVECLKNRKKLLVKMAS